MKGREINEKFVKDFAKNGADMLNIENSVKFQVSCKEGLSDISYVEPNTLVGNYYTNPIISKYRNFYRKTHLC
jgi:hypothetical protein